MPNCSVLGCNSGEKDTPQKFQMFMFPSFKDDPLQKSEKLQLLWIEQLNRKDWMPTRNSRVCERHFTIESFIAAGKNVTVKGTKKSRKTLTPRCEIFGFFFSSRSLKTREKYISFAQLVYFLREVCYFSITYVKKNIGNCEFYHSKIEK